MAKFCPECGTPTIKRADGGLDRDACPACGWVSYPNITAGVGALVFRGECVLLVERGIPPVGIWTFPSGYVEQAQNLLISVAREVKEETNLDVVARGIVCVRDTPRERRNDYYFCFVCDELDPTAEPQPDGFESTQARFVHPDEFDSINLSDFSRHVIEGVLYGKPQPVPNYEFPPRPGAVIFSMFGVEEKAKNE